MLSKNFYIEFKTVELTKAYHSVEVMSRKPSNLPFVINDLIKKRK